MCQPSAFILKGTTNTTTNWKTKTVKNNLFHSLLAHARTVPFSLPSSQTQCPQRLLQCASRLQLSAPTCREKACSPKPRKPLPLLHIPPRGVTHAVTQLRSSCTPRASRALLQTRAADSQPHLIRNYVNVLEGRCT